MRTPEFNGSLVIFINGKEIGIIATAVPEEVYGFVELRGDNDKVAITGNSTVDEVRGGREWEGEGKGERKGGRRERMKRREGGREREREGGREGERVRW